MSKEFKNYSLKNLNKNMTFIEHLQFLQCIDNRIARRGTGTARDLAVFMGISRSSVFNHLDTLRQLGAEIEFCEFRKSYYYVDDKRPRFPILSKSDSEKLQGGIYLFDFFSCSPKFLDWHPSPLYQVTQQSEHYSAGEYASFWL
jgi:hypothetical protein